MFNIGWTEMLVIAIVLIIVVGPKDLPALLRTFGRTMSQLRSMAGEFRSQFDEALREAELDDVRKTFSDAKKLNPARELRDAMNPLRKAGEELKSDIDRTMRGPAKSDETIAKKDPAAPASDDATNQTSTEKVGAAANSGNGSAAASPAARSGSPSANGSTAPAAVATPAEPKSTAPLKAGAVAPVAKDATPKPAAKKAAGRARKAGAGSSTTKTTARKAAPKKAGPTKKAGDA